MDHKKLWKEQTPPEVSSKRRFRKMLLGIQLYVLHRHGFNDPLAFHEPDREIFERRGSRHIGSGWVAPGRGSIRNVQVRLCGIPCS